METLDSMTILASHYIKEIQQAVDEDRETYPLTLQAKRELYALADSAVANDVSPEIYTIARKAVEDINSGVNFKLQVSADTVNGVYMGASKGATKVSAEEFIAGLEALENGQTITANISDKQLEQIESTYGINYYI